MKRSCVDCKDRHMNCHAECDKYEQPTDRYKRNITTDYMVDKKRKLQKRKR